MRQVTKDEFYKIIYDGKLDVCVGRPIGNYPYTTDFKFRNGNLFGRVVDKYESPEFKWPVISEYFLNE